MRGAAALPGLMGRSAFTPVSPGSTGRHHMHSESQSAAQLPPPPPPAPGHGARPQDQALDSESDDERLDAGLHPIDDARQCGADDRWWRVRGVQRLRSVDALAALYQQPTLAGDAYPLVVERLLAHGVPE